MRSHCVFVVVSLFFTTFVRSQIAGDSIGNRFNSNERATELTISPTVYNIDDSASVKIVELLEQYFATTAYFSMRPLPFDYKFWTTNTLKKYKMPDYLLRSALNPFESQKIVPDLIFIEKNEFKDYWIIKVAFSVFEKTNYKGLVCVYNYGVRNENNQFKLFNLFEIADLHLVKNSGCEFYVDGESNADSLDINKMITFNKTMQDFFGVKKTFKYVNVKDAKKMSNLLGFDFEMYMYIPVKNSAFCDLIQNTIYSSNNSFFNPHELVHLYVDEMFAMTCHPWFNEGLSTYWGGSMGLSLDEHLKKMNLFLSKNGKVNLNDLLNYVRIDEVTSYEYSIGGLLCKIVYEKHGKPGLLKFLNAGKSDEDFYKCIEIVLGVKRENLNQFLRKEIEKY
jgi:hypothetical protein